VEETTPGELKIKIPVEMTPVWQNGYWFA
jgi:hypothetical protein